MKTFQIHFDGQVQGVGFRPMVYSLATELNLKGTVCNDASGVNIVVSGEPGNCEAFYNTIINNPPPHAKIAKHHLWEIPAVAFSKFQIVTSKGAGKPSLLLTPDLAMCSSCRAELIDPGNRRYQYPFITCLHCGPRYSIIRRLPYDREHTTMADLSMCQDCKLEYHDPSDRRYFSQTNSCPDCAIQLIITDAHGKLIATHADEVINLMDAALRRGEILAVKGIGGYLLMADATNPKPIQRLRERKHRHTKPFALMYHDLDKVRQDANVSQKEADALEGSEHPVVLLRLKNETTSGICSSEVAPGLSRIGVMLPYAPLFELLMDRFKKPLVATSGNVSNSPIIFDDEKAVKTLGPLADYRVINSREIVVPQDDSVIQFTPETGQQIFHRRSRGYAPTFTPNPLGRSRYPILAMGGELKSAFALHDDENLHVSQYLGDLESYDTQESFQHTLNHLLRLCEVKPSKVIIDQHPVYFSSILGKTLASRYKAPLMQVQHHKAHFSAVLAEHELISSREPVLGVIWDGTGWGEDAAIWGGEFFVYKDYEFTRVDHLEYFNHFLGDKVAREPRLSALSLCRHLPQAQRILQPKFHHHEWELYTKMLDQVPLLETSSMGRLFDAVASLLGLCDQASYEGEAALFLETLASTTLPADRKRMMPGLKFDRTSLVTSIIDALDQGKPINHIAFQFHLTLVSWIEAVAARMATENIAFSGGVFQNALLVDLIREHLGQRYQLYFHMKLSPNDENIGFGQLAYHKVQELKIEKSAVEEVELTMA